jgi:hypothetical protein
MRERLSKNPGAIDPPHPQETDPSQEKVPSLLSHFRQWSRLSTATWNTKQKTLLKKDNEKPISKPLISNCLELRLHNTGVPKYFMLNKQNEKKMAEPPTSK